MAGLILMIFFVKIEEIQEILSIEYGFYKFIRD